MSSLNITTRDADKTQFMILDGFIDEKALLPTIPPGVEELILDLGDVQRINSMGVRLWIDWLRAVKETNPNLKLILDRCPRVFLGQAGIVMGLIPKNSEIRTICAPYFCERCDTEQTKLIELKILVEKKTQQAVLCATCNRPMAIDINLSQFSQFNGKA